MGERIPPWGDLPERYNKPRVPQYIVATPDIVLWRRGDDNFSDYYRAIVENEDFLGTFVPWAKDYTPARAALDQENAMKRVAEGSLAPYCIYSRGEFAGVVSLWGIREQSAHIGYWLVKAAVGQGTMTSAARELLHMGFTHLQLQEITAEVMPQNMASIRLVARLGGVPKAVTQEGELQFAITPTLKQNTL